jgi:hypothetical protein
MWFRTPVLLSATPATGYQVPDEVVAPLGPGRRPAVLVTVGGHSYRSTVASMGGVYMVPFSAAHREATGIAAGDEVDVDIELDSEPRTVDLPADFSDALDGEPRAREFFDGLSYSKQRWHVLSVEGAKTPETRQRRIEKSVEMLREGRAR